ncbi:MAG: helix-turn-helix domain-containing protein [Limisphaerales bacterium]
MPVDYKYEVICSQVASLLKEEREKRGFSLTFLAEKAGLSRQAITFVAQDQRTPTLETLLRLTVALEVDLEKIIARARRRVIANKTKTPEKNSGA